ncbi:hypothetical protein [Thalassotalea piscium]|uniref:Uncharacterized protein n=1 Tax=Thalassotalea piscium TaxID=1230533 RepID=A0A7X0NEK1_9GAMM|nr:hypothetical protein [Thalassotalea piscium]MBB6542006.1 hypothetical protein [Thalassotalea piscium]
MGHTALGFKALTREHQLTYNIDDSIVTLNVDDNKIPALSELVNFQSRYFYQKNRYIPFRTFHHSQLGDKSSHTPSNIIIKNNTSSSSTIHPLLAQRKLTIQSNSINNDWFLVIHSPIDQLLQDN